MEPSATPLVETDLRVSVLQSDGDGRAPGSETPSDAAILAEVEPLIQRMKTYLPHADFGIVKQAYQLAYRAHAPQRRDNGELYIRHPLAVANILTDLKLAPASIAAGLLHDVLEDTSVTHDELRRRFGDEITRIVDGVTKLTAIEGRSKEEAQAG